MLTKLGRKNPWAKWTALLVSKVIQGSVGVKGQPQVKLFRNFLRPLDLVGRTNDKSVTQSWGQRSDGELGVSYRVNQRSNCLEMPLGTKYGLCRFRAYDAAGALVTKQIQQYSNVKPSLIFYSKYLCHDNYNPISTTCHVTLAHYASLLSSVRHSPHNIRAVLHWDTEYVRFAMRIYWQKHASIFLIIWRAVASHYRWV